METTTAKMVTCPDCKDEYTLDFYLNQPCPVCNGDAQGHLEIGQGLLAMEAREIIDQKGRENARLAAEVKRLIVERDALQAVIDRLVRENDDRLSFGDVHQMIDEARK